MEPRAGFTLLEMLVAVTLMALITMLLTGSLSFGVRVWESSERLDERSRVASVQRLVFQWLQEAEQMRMPGEENDPLRGVFEGNSRALRFMGVQQGIGLPGGYYLNELYVSGDEEDAPALILRRRLVQPGSSGLTEATPETDGDRRVLVDNIAEVEIAYFGREAVSANPEWLDTWSGRLDLPLLVRIRLRFTPDDKRDWPELVVPLALTAG